MKKSGTRILVAAVCAAMCLPAAVGKRSDKVVDCGNLDELTLYSPQLEREVTIDVWTPPGYGENPAERYPVLYMHDGQNLFDANTTWNHQAWEIDSVMCRLLEEKKVRPAIVVGIYSLADTRVAELMPETPIEMIASTPVAEKMKQFLPTGAFGDRYIDFISTDVKQLIDSSYATLPDAANTFVMGSSMGGLASVNALCLRPDVYGGAGCLSTHWTGLVEPNEVFPTAMASLMLTKLPDGNTHKLYMDTGDQTLDAAYLPYYQRFYDLAEQLGYTGNHLMTGFYPGAAHDEDSWAKRVAAPLTFLLAPTE